MKRVLLAALNRQPIKPQLTDLLVIAKTEGMQEAICAAFRLGQDAERALASDLLVTLERKVKHERAT